MAKPGKRARYDYEYVRKGTANVFMTVDVHRPWLLARDLVSGAGPDIAQAE
jgi:hypothetical protein